MVQAPDAAGAYCPVGHATAVVMVLPAGHAYPAVQFPEQAGLVSPEAAPKVPAGQGPLQAGELVPGTAPYRPALQLLQAIAPARLYVPAGHWTAVGLVDPGGHANPATHSPLHVAEDDPDAAP
jgi:hypothetical protein